jgi:hypothetical protein
MEIEIISDCTASVTLTDREDDCLRAFRVPMIYGAGGMSPHPITTSSGPATVVFGGPVFVNPRRRLDEALALFAAALTAEIGRQDARAAQAIGSLVEDVTPPLPGGASTSLR